MAMTHKLFISVLMLASVTFSPVSLSSDAEVDTHTKPTTVRLDSIPEVSVTCYRCDELARKYRSSRVNDGTISDPQGLQQRMIEDTEEGE